MTEQTTIDDFTMQPETRWRFLTDQVMAGISIHAIRRDAGRLAEAPFRGERHGNLLPGLRHRTCERAINWIAVGEGALRLC